jgi:hypothetical protein
MKGSYNMKKNKVILKHCPNFYKINNFEFDEEDYISLKIVNIYSDYIFNIDENNSEEIKKIEELDTILSKYIDDYVFRKEIKEGLLNIKVKRGTNIIETIVNALLHLFEKYEEGYTRNIYFARWV